MLKEMTLLVIVLWGSQGMPTPMPTPQEPDFRPLSELYCKAEELLHKYKSVDKKHLSPEAKAKLKMEFSQPGCNITKSAEEEEYQILQGFKQLFDTWKSIHEQDELLKPVMGTFTLVIELQENYLNHTCPEEASDKMSQLDCPKYRDEGERPSRENMFHYIFELYKTFLHKFLSSKLKLNQNSPSEVCKAKGN